MKVSVFSIVKNEEQFIGYSVMSVLDFVDEIVYADGNSTDRTLELIQHIIRKYDLGKKIRVFEGWDCSDFKDDYIRLFNDLMKECRSEYLWFLHPDMIVTNPERIKDIGNDLAYCTNLRSFAGEDLTLEIVKGRTAKWKNIMKNEFGLHYWGWYGHDNEDMYFRDITSDEHVVYREMEEYPFFVGDSGINIEHYCECKPYKRRSEKMGNVIKTCWGLENNDAIKDVVANHPRVHLQSQKSRYGEFEFKKRKDELPVVFGKYREEFGEILNEMPVP